MGHSLNAVTGAAYPNLWSHGTKQYGVFGNFAGSFIVCQFDRTTKALEATFDLGTIAGNPFATPMDTTNIHRAAAIGITPNGIIYIAGNHHSETTLRVAKFTIGGDITNAANWSDAKSEFFVPVGRQFGYPHFVRFAGSTLFTYKTRVTTGASPGEQCMFRHNGTSWTDLGFHSKGQVGSEESVYYTTMYVECDSDPHPNRAHWFGAWDFAFGGVDDFTIDHYHYMYSDDEASTWCNVEDVPLTIPYDSTYTPPRTGISFGDPALHNLYASGCGIDADGNPVGTYIDRHAPARVRLIRWNGAAWVVDTALGARYAGGQEPLPIRFRGDLWIFARPLGGGADTTKAELRRLAAPNEIAYVAAPVGINWICYWDPVAYHESGVIEMLHINDDVPRVTTFGNNARAIAAVA